MLTIPTKGRYSIRILARIASHQRNNTNNGRIIRKKEISKEEDISEDYAEQILMRLKAAGFIESRRGPTGGFTLAKPADSISVLDILQAMEGNVAIAPCADDPCDRYSSCAVKKVWLSAQQAIVKVFKNTTIADIANENDKINSKASDYTI